MVQEYKIVNVSSASSGANAVVANRVFSLWDDTLDTPAAVAMCEYLKVEKSAFKYRAYAAGTRGVRTLTIGTPVVGDEYKIVVTSTQSSTGQIAKRTYRAVAGVSPTATTVGDAIRLAITNDANAHVAGSGTTTLILTAALDWEAFTVYIEKGGAAGTTQANTTPGVTANGKYAQLVAQGHTSGAQSTGTYDAWEFVYGTLVKDKGDTTRYQMTKRTYYVNVLVGTNANYAQARTDIAAALSIGDESTDIS